MKITNDPVLTQGQYDTLLRKLDDEYDARGVNGADNFLKGESVVRREDLKVPLNESKEKVPPPSIQLPVDDPDTDALGDIAEKLTLMPTEHKTVLFSLYRMMELMLEVAQDLRDAMREERQAEVTSIQTTIQCQADIQKTAALTQFWMGIGMAGTQMAFSGAGFIAQGKSAAADIKANQALGQKLNDANSQLDVAGLAAKGDSGKIDMRLDSLAKNINNQGDVPNLPVDKTRSNGLQELKIVNRENVSKSYDINKSSSGGNIGTELQELNDLNGPKVDQSSGNKGNSVQNSSNNSNQNGQLNDQGNVQPSIKNDNSNNGKIASGENPQKGVPKQEVANQEAPKGKEAVKEDNAPDQNVAVKAKDADVVPGESEAAAKVRKAIGLERSESAKAETLRNTINDAGAKPGARQAAFKELTGFEATSLKEKTGSEYTLSNDDRKLMNQSVQSAYDMDAEAIMKSGDPKAGLKVEALRTIEARNLVGNKPGAEAFHQKSLEFRDALQNKADRGVQSPDGASAGKRAQVYAASSIMLGQMSQSLPTAVGQLIQSKATQKQAEQKSQEEMLDQNKDLFSNAMEMVNRVIQLFAEVTRVEAESIRSIVA